MEYMHRYTRSSDIVYLMLWEKLKCPRIHMFESNQFQFSATEFFPATSNIHCYKSKRNQITSNTAQRTKQPVVPHSDQKWLIIWHHQLHSKLNNHQTQSRISIAAINVFHTHTTTTQQRTAIRHNLSLTKSLLVQIFWMGSQLCSSYTHFFSHSRQSMISSDCLWNIIKFRMGLNLSCLLFSFVCLTRELWSV